MIVSELDVFTDFGVLCDQKKNFKDKGGLTIWVDYFNYYINQNNKDFENSNQFFNPMKSNVNFQSGMDNVCKEAENHKYLTYRHFFYQEITAIPAIFQSVWKMIFVSLSFSK